MYKRQNITYNYISDYLFSVRSKGRYSVTLNELRNQFDVSEKALLQNLYRLKSKNQIAQIRKEFYVIIPPQYSHRCMLPPSLFIDDMMKFLKRKYYVGLFSAAALHGAGHQQPMEYQVITGKPPLRNIKNNKLILSFFIKSEWDIEDIAEKKTEAGYINVSSPELTAFDLVYYNKKIGGFNRVIPILEDLSEEMKPSVLARIAKKHKAPIIQRLGYLSDAIGNESLSSSLWKTAAKKDLKEVALSLAHKNREGTFDEKWKVVINTELRLIAGSILQC